MKLTDAQIAAIKTATHLLLDRVGGLVAAASACNKSVSRLSEFQSRNHPDAIMPLDTVLMLEVVAGEPILTSAIARLQGLTLARPDAAAAPEIGRAVALAARSLGVATAAYVEAQTDGRIDASERADLARHFQTVRDAADAALAGLTGPALRSVA